jgi:hypothetical protein
MPLAQARRVSAGELTAEIRRRYEPPEWFVEGELTLGSRRLDLVAFGCWGQRRIVGFEIKVERGDWLRELGDFRKSEEWCAVVDAFYLATVPGVVKGDELPEGWGLLELAGSRLMTRRHATTRTDPPATFPRELATRLLSRRAQAESTQNFQENWKIREQAMKDAEASARQRLEAEYERDAETAERIAREHREIFLALGVRPSEWHAHERAIRAAGIFAAATTTNVGLKEQLDRGAESFERMAKQMREASGSLVEAAR